MSGEKQTPRELLLPGTLILGLFVLLVGIRVDWPAWLRGPAPYPPEWQWGYLPKPLNSSILLPLLFAAGLLGLLALSGLPLLMRRRKAALFGLLTAATLLGWAFHLSLVSLTQEGATEYILAKAMRPVTISYYNVAISPDADDAARFVDEHADLLPRLRRSALHAATHPPLPVLYFRGLLGFFRSHPDLSRWIVSRAPLKDRVRTALRERYSDAEISTALIGVSLMPLLCVLTCWPIAFLASALSRDPPSALRIGILWTLVPAAALFVGAVDQILALPVTLAVAGLCHGWLTPSRPARIAVSLASGLLAGLAIQLSYGAPVFLLAGFAVVIVIARSHGRSFANGLLPMILALAGSLAVFWGPALIGHEPLRAAETALTIHRENFTQPRGYLLWLGFNPLDFLLFLGPPVVAGAAMRAARSRGPRRVDFGPRSSTSWQALGAVLGIVALLNLSGVVRGEVGRLWIPFVPWVLVPALSLSGGRIERTIPEGVADPTPSGKETSVEPVLPAGSALLVGLCQLALTLTLRLSWRL